MMVLSWYRYHTNADSGANIDADDDDDTNAKADIVKDRANPCSNLRKGLRAMGYGCGLWAIGYGLWVLGYGLSINGRVFIEVTFFD